MVKKISISNSLCGYSESLNYAPSSGEIVVSERNLNVIDTIKIEY